MDVLSDQPLRPVQQAEMWCQKENLTGPFYHACLFDMAVTEDLDVVLMAKEAQQDWERLAPVDSRTDTPSWTWSPRSAYRSSAFVALGNSALWPNVRWSVMLLSLFFTVIL